MMSEPASHNEVHMTTPDLIKIHGYIPETHRVWTEDGYCVDVHRVVSPDDKKCSTNLNSNVNIDNSEIYVNSIGKKLESTFAATHISKPTQQNAVVSKPPVIVNHGLLSSSADWVLLGPQKAMAYTLCDNGFDVWLANARGNEYSKCHKRYDVKDKEFWDFSWHEIGYYDLPATIDYVLEKTGHSKVYYIGYSQGTTVFYVMCSERPEYNAKVKGMISLAPVAFISNQRSPLLKCVVHFYSVIEWGSFYCNIHQWFPRNRLQARALGTLIRNAPYVLTKSFCNCWFYPIAGFGSNQLDKAMLPLIFAHFPAGTSAKQILHYSQSILTGSFSKFDYGAARNLKIYGSTQPPNYNLEKVKVPVAIFYSENDFLTHPIDVQKLANKLPNVTEMRKIEYSKFNHIDFLWGCDAKTLLYNRIVKVLRRF